jgi:acetyl esterase/lipase
MQRATKRLSAALATCLIVGIRAVPYVTGQDLGSGDAPRQRQIGKNYADLEYARIRDRKLRLDLTVPDQGPGPFPLVIRIHGGAWQAGTWKWHPPAAFLREGYALASIEYRLSGEATFPAAIEDCKAAVRWLRAHAEQYHLDPEHFGAWGESAGGHLAALLGTSGGAPAFEAGDQRAFPSRVQAVCDWFGPTDFLQINSQARAGAGSVLDHDAPHSPESRFIGGPIQQNQNKVRKANPITYVTKDAPPFLIVHGAQDRVVPVGQSRLLEAALRKAGVEVALIVLPDAGHGGAAFGAPEVQKQMLAFFDRHLKKSQLSPRR